MRVVDEVTLGGNSLGLTSLGDQREESLVWGTLVLTGLVGGNGGAELYLLKLLCLTWFPTAALLLPGLASSSCFCPVVLVPPLGSVPRCS